MSGPLCPDCGWGRMDPDLDYDRGACLFCGWEGGRRPNVALRGEDAQRRMEAFAEKVRRREAGELFFLRVYQAGAERPDLVFEVMDVLGLNHASASGNPLYFEVPSQPTDEQRAALEALPGVARIEVR